MAQVRRGGQSVFLRKYHTYYGDDLTAEFPTGSDRGLGASHQTGWTACIADLLQRVGEGK